MSGASGMSEYPDDMDPEKHYLELSNRERATLEVLNEKFDNIIVIVNCAAAMEMGFIEEYDSIKAAVYVPGGPGQNGFNALGSILVGDVNPSGKTVDTVIYDLKQAPTWNEDIAYHFGESIGQMADEMNVSGWYAPAMNNHRSAFSGRNFEYYSEDGFLGMVLTDYFMGGLYQDADIQIRNGNDFCLSPMGGGTDVLDDQSSATSLLAARQACKNILFVTANSRGYSDEVLNPGMPTWQILTYAISAVIAALLVLWEVKVFEKFKAAKAETVETVNA